MKIDDFFANLELRNNSYILGVMPSIDSYKLVNTSKSIVSKRIQAHGNKKIKKRNRWSHIAMLFFDSDDSQWYVYESHFKDGGVVKRKLLDWWFINSNQKNNRIEIVQHNDLDKQKADEILKKPTPYGIMDIKNILKIDYLANMPIASWFYEKILKKNIKNGDGMTCSEYVYACCQKFDQELVYKFEKGTITPSDIQVWQYHQGDTTSLTCG